MLEHAQLAVSPVRALVDEPVAIRLVHARPGSPVTLRAAMSDHRGAAWESEATFTADARGAVDLGRDAPLAGSYQGVDPMGLFWSMRPGVGAPLALLTAAPLQITVRAEVAVVEAVSTTAERLFLADGVTEAQV
jgi:hypothetical protein